MIVGNATLHLGDALTVLEGLESESVHTCITSPPYWGMRDYGHPEQIGLEPTLGEFLEKLVAVFDEVRRVLRADGTCWLNMGDAYNSGTTAVRKPSASASHGYWEKGGTFGDMRVKADGLKPKDLIGQPWRLAFALQDAGWYLRQDIIWHKPNPMPESVLDRCTKSHEYIFLLAKSRKYYFDQDAIREPVSERRGRYTPKQNASFSAAISSSGNKERKVRPGPKPANQAGSNLMGSVPWEGDTRNKRSVWSVVTQAYPEAHYATFPEDLIRPCVLAGSPEGGVVLDPFSGSGTTGAVALEHGRHYIGIELSPEYMEFTRQRCEDAQRQQRLFS